MVSIICQVEILIYESKSLKEKRSVIKSIINKTKSKFCISIIESDYHDYWQKTKLGFSLCSIDSSHALKKYQEIIKYIESSPYIEIYNIEKEEIVL
ncbi:MAG: DUF503 domain-containing protein [Eubacteriaceae bacterium]